MANRPYLLRFFWKFLVETCQFITGQQMMTALLLAILGTIYQYKAGRLTWEALKENSAAVAFPFIWVLCGFASYYVVKAAIHLHREMAAEVDAYRPAVAGYKPKRPSRLPGIVTASGSIAVLALVAYVSFIAAFPTTREPETKPSRGSIRGGEKPAEKHEAHTAQNQLPVVTGAVQMPTPRRREGQAERPGLQSPPQQPPLVIETAPTFGNIQERAIQDFPHFFRSSV